MNVVFVQLPLLSQLKSIKTSLSSALPSEGKNLNLLDFNMPTQHC